MYSAEDGSLSCKTINLVSLHDWLTAQDEHQGVEHVKVTFHVPGWMKRPHEMIYGKVALKDIKALHQQHGDALIAGNIRSFQGATEVNQAIAETLATQPEKFMYLNNGITAYCGRMEMMPASKLNHEIKEVTAHRFSIVNGAQTVGVISGADNAVLENGYVFMRLVSLERMEDDREFAKLITTTTNYQNRVRQRDLASVEPEQRAIAETLKMSGISYQFKKAKDSWPEYNREHSFTSDDALIVGACIASFADGSLCARLRSDKDSLWRNDDGDESKQQPSSYERIFSPAHSPRMLWRGTQAMRTVADQFNIFAETENDSEYVDCVYFSYFLILALVFQKHHPERGEELYLKKVEISDIARTAQTCFAVVWDLIKPELALDSKRRRKVSVAKADSFWIKLFGSPTNCKKLWDQAMSKI